MKISPEDLFSHARVMGKISTDEKSRWKLQIPSASLGHDKDQIPAV